MICKDSVRKAVAFVAVFSMCFASLVALIPVGRAEPYEISMNVGTLPEPRLIASVAMGDDGRIYVIGGREGTTGFPAQSSVIIFNTTTKESTYGTPMIIGTSAAPAVKWTDGKIYVFGGLNSTGTFLSNVQVYNPVMDSWSVTTSMPKAVFWSTAAIGPDNRIYLFGGMESSMLPNNSTLIFNVTSATWSYGKDSLNPRWGSSAVSVEADAIWLIGGGDNSGNSGNLVEIYHPLSDTWSYADNLTSSRSHGGAAYGRNGQLYVFGGSTISYISPTPGQVVSATERHTAVVGDGWQTISSFSYGFASFGTCVDKYGRVYVVGGYDGTNPLSTVYYFLPSDISGRYELLITSPADGSVVSDIVTINAMAKNSDTWSGWPVFQTVDLLIDGVWHESQTMGWSWSFLWDTIGVPDSTTHTITVRGYCWDGTVEEASVTVTVWAQSVAEHVAAIEADIAAVQADIGSLTADLADVDLNLSNAQADITAIQAEIAELQDQLGVALANLNNLTANVTSGDAALTALIATLQARVNTLETMLGTLTTMLNTTQTALDRMEGEIDENNQDTQAALDTKMSSTMGYVNLALIVIVLLLVLLMFMMVRKKQ